MNDFLISKNWYNSGACGCTPQKYTWKNNVYPNHKFKLCPSRQTWQLFEFDHLIAQGQSVSLETQYLNIFK
jgi:hypothetical protein